MTKLVGQRLGSKYDVQAEIGHGGMGVVYRGFDAKLRRPVAIKVLSPALATDPQFVQRFEQEAVLAASLRHPNVVTIHDVGSEGDVHYIVMEYLDGATLEQALRQRGPMPLPEASQVMRQVAAALDYAHGRQIIHRDVKPANIMLLPDGQVKLMDFGLVRAMEGSGLTRSGTVLGTPEYMSPEQALGVKVDHRSDVYSLGIVGYKLLSGHVPFERTTPYGVTYAHVNEPPPPLSDLGVDVPPALQAVIDKALAKRPEDRYEQAGLLAREFAVAITGRIPDGVKQPTPTGLKPAATPGLPASASVAGARRQGSAGSRARAAPPAGGRKGLPAPVWIGLLAMLAVVLVALAVVLSRRPEAEIGVASPAPMVEVATVQPTPTAVARPTERAKPAGVAAAATPRPTATSAPTPPPPTAPPVLTPQIRVTGGAVVNVRSGPGTEFERVGRVRQGETYSVVGQDASAAWWQICCVDGEKAWISADLVETSGPVDGVGRVEVTRAPTPTTAPPTLTRPPQPCDLAPGPTFARVWNRARLGCPVSSETGITSAYETFQRGFMLWRQDDDGHYAVYGDGRFDVFFYPPAEPPNFACDEAAALDRPRRGFSKVWCENPQVRSRIGNAVDDEAGDTRPLQVFENGFMVYLKERGRIFALYKNGAWTEMN